MRLASAASAREIDRLASADWGLDSFALVEAAGRACASNLLSATGDRFASHRPKIITLIGSGNNGADALVLLRALLFQGLADARHALVIRKSGERHPGGAENVRKPATEALKSVTALGVKSVIWKRDDDGIGAALREAEIILDGLAGTGIEGALSGAAAEMVRAVEAERGRSGEAPIIVSIDVPSGLGDAWRVGMPAVRADLTLAIEPVKTALFNPDARPLAGRIVPVSGIFPSPLLERTDGGALTSWAEAARAIASVHPWAYKHERGVVEIRAGSIGATGAASLAARGAQAAGAGLVRLLVDSEIVGILAASAGGVMVTAADPAPSGKRFSPDCVLAGPGWGRGEDRSAVLASLALAERSGLALVLDADAIALGRATSFSGNTILTPHPGELAEYLALPKTELLAAPAPHLKAAAHRANVVIVLKGHVTWVAAPDGRLAVIDGMAPVLAMGGSGDVLAGLTAAIAARSIRSARAAGNRFDPFPAAVAASALLAEAGRVATGEVGFCDPAEIARIAGRLAADAWLEGGDRG